MPSIENVRIGFIGAGRLGKALAWHCADQGLNVTAVSSLIPSDAEHFVSRISACNIMSAQAVAQHCDLIFVTTPDASIEAATNAIQWSAQNSVVHCSGATEIDVLKKAQQDGAQIGGFHPLQAFGDPAVAVKSLPGSTITIEASAPLDACLIELATQLDCHVNQIPPGTRALYHAAAGYTSQFIHVLFQEACNMWRTWGSADEATVRALMALAQGTLSAISKGGLVAGMPGPVSRGDITSVDKHLHSLKQFTPDAVALYSELCERTVRIALENNRIDQETAAEFRTLFALAHKPAGSA